MSPDWNPTLYRRFEDERTRPARDLLARVPLTSAARIVDLGCGPGNSTELLAQSYPDASIVATDTSPAMLDSARQRLPQCQFELSDVTSWQPSTPPQLIFANAVLHWVPDHGPLLTRLLSTLAPGGVLAVQLPDNLNEPSHRLMEEVASEASWSSLLVDASRARASILSPEAYYDLLASQAAHVEVWRTVYYHPLSSTRAISEWLQTTGLRPFLEPLSAEQRVAFLARYEAALEIAYPARSDGQRLLAFPRSFLVAQRAG